MESLCDEPLLLLPGGKLVNYGGQDVMNGWMDFCMVVGVFFAFRLFLGSKTEELCYSSSRHWAFFLELYTCIVWMDGIENHGREGLV